MSARKEAFVEVKTCSVCEDVGRALLGRRSCSGTLAQRIGRVGRRAKGEVHGSMLGLAHDLGLQKSCAVHTIPPCSISLPHIQGSKDCSSSFVCPPQPSPSF